MLAWRNLQVEPAKYRLSAGIMEIDVLKGDVAAERYQLASIRPVNDAMVLPDNVDRVSNAGNKLTCVDQAEGEITRAVQYPKGDRHRQNHIAGLTFPSRHSRSVQLEYPRHHRPTAQDRAARANARHT